MWARTWSGSCSTDGVTHTPTDSVFSWNQDISGLQDHEFQIRHPDSPALLYQFRLGDEKLQVTSRRMCSWVDRKSSLLSETRKQNPQRGLRGLKLAP